EERRKGDKALSDLLKAVGGLWLYFHAPTRNLVLGGAFLGLLVGGGKGAFWGSVAAFLLGHIATSETQAQKEPTTEELAEAYMRGEDLAKM
ncbi:MAG: hypothetical protein ACE5K2_06770, partial [Candidatus Zixiibacteriota bacterium]